ncbi:MAG: hypothetical protein M1836_008032 [Candelina mexicana]|nr:MAG: hypothetical protein M1836_008032 [Candelina mexicana]
MILHHVAKTKSCWHSITTSFNEEFGTDLTIRCIVEKYKRERTSKDFFNRYLHENNSVPPEFKEEYDDIIRRHGPPTFKRQHMYTRMKGQKCDRFLYTEVQTRFVVILEHLTKGQYSVSKNRWPDIASFFNYYFNKQVTYEKLAALWRRARAKNSSLFRSLQETGTIPDEFQKEYQDILQAYDVAGGTCYAESSTSNDALSECSIANGTDPGPGTDDDRVQSGINAEAQSDCSSADHDDPALTPNERLFLILLEHFSCQTWEELTECVNCEFSKSYERIVLVQQWGLDRRDHPLCEFLKKQGRVPQEHAEYLNCILSKYGLGDIVEKLKDLTCDEFFTCEHSGPVHPCAGSHATEYNICESCRLSAFNEAADFTPHADNQLDFGCDESLGLSIRNVCVRPPSDRWLCLECQLSHRLGT